MTGVVVCVGKKLSKMQSELNAVAASLGADFRSACKSGFTSLLQSTCVQLVWIEEQTLIFRVKTQATSRLSDHPLPYVSIPFTSPNRLLVGGRVMTR